MPWQLTVGVLASLVVLVTSAAPVWKWKRAAAQRVALGAAVLLAIPTFLIIQAKINERRFGVFRYAAASEVDDFRVLRYLPGAARDITIEKQMQGHRARYVIAQSDLVSFVNAQWNRVGQRSAADRNELGDGRSVAADTIDDRFADLGWPPFDIATRSGKTVQRPATFLIRRRKPFTTAPRTGSCD